MKYTIAQRLVMSYHATLVAMKEGRDWVDPTLQAMQDSGQISCQPLGPQLEYEGQLYEIQEHTIRIVWSKLDELKEDQNQLVHDLITNAVHLHDTLLLEKIGNNQAVFSIHYRYDLGNVVELPTVAAFSVLIYTVFAILPPKE